MITKLTPQQSRRINALIRRECCNYDNGNCILLDDGEPCVCPQIITFSHIICKWCKSAVLPLDKELYIQLAKPPNTKICAVCGKPFIFKGNKAKYCNSCKVYIRRRKQVQYQQKYKRNKGKGLSKQEFGNRIKQRLFKAKTRKAIYFIKNSLKSRSKCSIFRHQKTGAKSVNGFCTCFFFYAYLFAATCNSFLACVNITVSAAGISKYILSMPISVFGV